MQYTPVNVFSIPVFSFSLRRSAACGSTVLFTISLTLRDVVSVCISVVTFSQVPGRPATSPTGQEHGRPAYVVVPVGCAIR